ncbi:MAG: nucleotidyltransferase domain-containing protein [Candidatus Margulisbacteria bacterium]|jgi:predicted nucleotidyltransferase|nr:nucleotidyltransferase domain-containing protein [Candidatus Margulisiibacteriota bacterium]
MLNSNILSIKDKILASVNCRKIILFGSYAYGEPHADSDYDFYVVLDDNAENPLRVMQKICCNLGNTNLVPVDVLADYQSRFEKRSKLPTMERKIAREGIVLYDRN